jgi:uncharacterized protein (TIGR02246 family)
MMRKISFLILALVFMLSMACQQKVNIESEKAAIKNVLDNYVASVENEDMELYAKNMAHDSDMVNFGTSEDPIIGWDALRKIMEDQNAALSQTKIDVTNMAIHVSETGKLAWATCLWDFKAMMGENPIELPVRCTWILEKRGNDWVIVHFHKSIQAK